MATIDPEQERQRLAKLYEALSDQELEEVGNNPMALTDWAFEAVRAEMLKRGFDWIGKDMPLPSQMTAVEATDDPGNRPVVLRRYRDMPAAFVEKSVLEDAGIECFLQDDNVVRMDWLWSNAMGGIKLVVRQKDAEEAETLLKQDAPEKFTVEGVGEYEQEHCPKCGSNDVSCNELKKRIAGAGLLLGVPIAMVQRGWNCHACGHTWNAEEEGKPRTT
jgi:hypothetical protein